MVVVGVQNLTGKRRSGGQLRQEVDGGEVPSSMRLIQRGVVHREERGR
jgi:hypothetical protein